MVRSWNPLEYAFKKLINDLIRLLSSDCSLHQKGQLNVIARLTKNQNSDLRKETANEWTTVRHNKNIKGLSSRQKKFQNSKTCALQCKSKTYPNKFWSRKITQQYSQRKEMQTWIMSFGEDQIFTQQKGTFRNYKKI